MMKICFLVPNAYSLFNARTRYPFGGSEVRAWLLGKGLSELPGYEVCFTTFDHGQSEVEKFGNVLVYKDVYFGAKQATSNQVNSVLSRGSRQVLRLLGRIKNDLRPSNSLNFEGRRLPLHKFKTYLEIDADVYCVFGAANYSAELIFFAKQFGKKIILFSGSDADFSSNYLLKPDKTNEYGSLNKLCAYSIRNADFIVTQSDGQERLLQERFQRDSTITIKNPIDLEVSSVSPIVPGGKNIFLWLGKSDHIKQPDILLAVARLVPEAHFIMIMNRSNNDVYDHIQQAKPVNVEILEYVPFREIDLYFAKARALINTSKFEGFPNTFLQAGKHFCPVLSLNVDPDGFFSRHGCGFFVDGDIESMAAIVSKMLCDDDTYSHWASNIHSFVQKNHRLGDKVHQLDKFLKKEVIL